MTDERGETLVEVLVTVVVLSLSVLGIVTGIGAGMRIAHEHRDMASSTVALVLAAEAVEGYSASGATCGTLGASTYAAALSSVSDLPPGWSTSNLSIAAASCATVAGTALPRVTVRATPPDGSGAVTLDVVRRSIP